ncbi:MAG: hypothetical protein LBS61_04915 [Endomicrobium sp.]|jgi:hypothetical protein|nr:hypothetical protein [Endomicrobium sp.]
MEITLEIIKEIYESKELAGAVKAIEVVLKPALDTCRPKGKRKYLLI